jgi:EAL domain-containing protein (putative c-di-GMP-specific phosphodiesterase class I)
VIGEIGAWVLEQSYRQLADWDRVGFRVPRLAVNRSLREIEYAELATLVCDVLQRHDIDPPRLELEVTETTIMRRAEAALETLVALQELGITLAVDDFGTGYSSLVYPKRLSLTRLKIDRSFVEKINQDQNDDAIARDIIGLALSLGLEVLAEGIGDQRVGRFPLLRGLQRGPGASFQPPGDRRDTVGRLVPRPLTEAQLRCISVLAAWCASARSSSRTNPGPR